MKLLLCKNCAWAVFTHTRHEGLDPAVGNMDPLLSHYDRFVRTKWLEGGWGYV